MRRHVTYANVAATLALVLSMGGGVLAASHYLVTSTSQIKPSVRRALHGARGSQGPAGASIAGPQGPAGPRGLEGPRGGEANLRKLCDALYSESERLGPTSYTGEALANIWRDGCL
jgi:hypothetical protein